MADSNNDSLNRRILLVLAVFLSISLELVITGPAILSDSNAALSRNKRESDSVAVAADDRDWKDETKDVVDELEEDMLEWWETMWGGTCFKEGDACSAISYCHIEDEIIDIFGECRMTWWFLLILIGVVVLLLSAIISCCCCPCCCLYDMCKACCCCCCRSEYSRASTG